MFDVGGGELIVILLGIVVLFGPKKLPEIANMLGKGLQKARGAQMELRDQLRTFESDIRSNIESADKTPTREQTPIMTKADDLIEQRLREKQNKLNSADSQTQSSKDETKTEGDN
ncbi:MAG: twin-arginine translocase TatA/TatE family subunit [Chloroflexota bacterium]